MILLDYSPVNSREMGVLEFSTHFGIDDLRDWTNASADRMLDLMRDLTDAQVTFLPRDDQANDPYAVTGEEHIGWSLGHLVVHVTASSEEWATYSAVLARGIVYPAEPRLRYETSWHDITSQAQCVQRLEESRRMRLAYLDAWPDTPRLDVFRELAPRYVERFGQMNAPAAFLFGLMHEVNHFEQLSQVARQARAVLPTVSD